MTSKVLKALEKNRANIKVEKGEITKLSLSDDIYGEILLELTYDKIHFMFQGYVDRTTEKMQGVDYCVTFGLILSPGPAAEPKTIRYTLPIYYCEDQYEVIANRIIYEVNRHLDEFYRVGASGMNRFSKYRDDPTNKLKEDSPPEKPKS